MGRAEPEAVAWCRTVVKHYRTVAGQPLADRITLGMAEIQAHDDHACIFHRARSSQRQGQAEAPRQSGRPGRSRGGPLRRHLLAGSVAAVRSATGRSRSSSSAWTRAMSRRACTCRTFATGSELRLRWNEQAETKECSSECRDSSETGYPRA